MNHLKRVLIAVGMALSGHPPHRSVRADFPHTALTSDDDVRNAVRDRDAGSSAPAASRRKVPMLGHGHVDCGVAWCEARVGKGMSSARNSSCRAISESVLRAINWSRGWNNQTIGRGESAEGERNLHSVQLREIGGLGNDDSNSRSTKQRSRWHRRRVSRSRAL